MITLSPECSSEIQQPIIQVYSEFEPLRCHFLLLRQAPITSAQAVTVQDNKFA